MTAKKALGVTIRKLRLASKLTLAELSAKCGVSLGYISQIERGNHSPSLPVLYKVTVGLGAPLSAVFRQVESLSKEEIQ